MRFHKTPRIAGAGFMADYACTARCRHCLYGCSNRHGAEYVSPEAADRIMAQLAEAGVTSLHIGGGEPFLNFEGLCAVAEAMDRHGIAVDYIETNAFWCVNVSTAAEKLRRLKSLGVDTVMASVDPFHIEFVPLARVYTFVEAAEQARMGYFLWQERFLRRLSALDPSVTHTREELQAALGEHYIADAAREYGVGMNGRALQIARELYGEKPARELLDDAPCTRMLAGRHCHIDLYGSVVPAGCTGIAIPIADFTAADRSGLEDLSRWPVLGRLLTGGAAALYDYAVSLGFPPETRAATKCDLCYRLRRFLRDAAPCPEIGPDAFYTMMED